MVFVPLFDIVLGGVDDHEVGSASSVLQAMQQLGMSLGIAGIGTLFFGLLGAHADRTARLPAAAQAPRSSPPGWSRHFALGFLLPGAARAQEAPGWVAEPAVA